MIAIFGIFVCTIPDYEEVTAFDIQEVIAGIVNSWSSLCVSNACGALSATHEPLDEELMDAQNENGEARPRLSKRTTHYRAALFRGR